MEKSLPEQSEEKYPEYTIVRADDWEGLYLDSLLVTEGHEVTFHDLIQETFGLPFVLREISTTDKFTRWVQNNGSMPKTLTKVRKLL